MHVSRTVSASMLALALCLAASEVRAQRPQGNDLRVNQHTAGIQWVPDVAAAADGSFVVVWRDGTAASEPSYVMARLFDAAGRSRGGEIRVARVTTQVFGRPSVAMAPDGRFVVVWAGGQEDPSLSFGRRFAADGTPLGSRFRLARISGQEEPDVAMAADGSFVAAWTQAVERDGERDLDIYLRRFRADGRPRGPEVAVVSGEQEESGPRIALRPGGGLVIAWEIWLGESSFFDIRAQLFSATGAPASDELVVNEGSPSPEASQHNPSVAVATDGSFAVVWTDRDGDPGPFDPADGLKATGVRARFYEADGTAFGPERSVNSYVSGLQELPAIDATPGGGYFVIWASGSSSAGVGQDGDGYGIFGRAYGVDGTRQSREIRINRNPAGAQFLPALSIASSGKGAAVWNTANGLESDVFARRLGVPR